MTSTAQDIELLKQSDLLDATWYAAQYPDVAAVGIPPAEHYLRFGARLLRDPGPKFSTRGYLDANPDVAQSGVNALLHHLRNHRLHSPAPGQLVAVTAQPAKPSAQATVKIEPAVKGFFDRLDATSLGGWAIDSSKPGRPVDLAVYVDGARL